MRSFKIEGRLEVARIRRRRHARPTGPPSSAIASAAAVAGDRTSTGASRGDRPDALPAGDGLLARALHRLDARREPPGARPRAVREEARRLSRHGGAQRLGLRRRATGRRRSRRATAWSSTPARHRPRTGRAHLPIWTGDRLFFDRRASVDPSRVSAGHRVCKTDDPRARTPSSASTWAGDRRRARARAAAAARSPAAPASRCGSTRRRFSQWRVANVVPSNRTCRWPRRAPSRSRPERLREQLGRLGGTPYHLAATGQSSVEGEVHPAARAS